MPRAREAAPPTSQAVLPVKHGVGRGRERFGPVIDIEHDHVPTPVCAEMGHDVALYQAHARRQRRRETRVYVGTEPAQHGAGPLRDRDPRLGGAEPFVQRLQKARQRVSEAEAAHEDLWMRRAREQAGETTKLVLRRVILAVHQLPAVGAYHVHAVPLVEIELVTFRRGGRNMGPHARSIWRQKMTWHGLMRGNAAPPIAIHTPAGTVDTEPVARAVGHGHEIAW